MKKVVAFLLALIIFVAPVTTLVKADVVIGDNDETIINENAIILGRKLALMESLSDLALSGVTEFTISNTNDVDSYLDYLWEEIGDAIDSLSNGTGFTEISNSLKSKYFTNLVQYKDYINNRGDYFAHLLPSGNPTTNLLSTFFANNIFGKHSTLHNNLSLDTFKALASLNRGQPVPSPDLNYSRYIELINGKSYNYDYLQTDNWFSLYNNNLNSGFYYYSGDASLYSFMNRSIDTNLTHFNNGTYYNKYIASMSGNKYKLNTCYSLSLLDIYINSSNGNYIVTTSALSAHPNYINNRFGGNTPCYSGSCEYDSVNQSYSFGVNTSDTSYPTLSTFTYQGSLEDCFKVISMNFRNVNIYVNGDPWSIVNLTNYPTIDIDGYLKIYDGTNPQYELQPGTQIDYDQLYQVIYNAIRDNLPISQGDINYYDSHDTIYSPTIINNYGEDEGDESDLIDTILDYAVIPKFDTAIAQPMRQALTNGVVIMNNSITNVIPNEILLILGACFFLLLFAVVINRMIK